MNLSGLFTPDLLITEDTEFSSVGHLLGTGNQRIVPIYRPEDILLAMENEEVTGIIIPGEFSPLVSRKMGLVLSPDPVLIALRIQKEISQCTLKSTIQPGRRGNHTIIHPTARVAATAVIGDRVVISEYVSIEERTQIGNNVFIGPHTHIGVIPGTSENHCSEYSSLACGEVIIGDESNIQSHCTIERPLFSDTTKIGSRCHIDSQCTIRQGSRIGNCTLLAAIVTIGEYVQMGEECWAGPRTNLGNGVIIGDECYITLGSSVTKNIKSGMVVRDNYAIRKERFSGVIP